jgi:hypothetical protein
LSPAREPLSPARTSRAHPVPPSPSTVCRSPCHGRNGFVIPAFFNPSRTYPVSCPGSSGVRAPGDGTPCSRGRPVSGGPVLLLERRNRMWAKLNGSPPRLRLRGRDTGRRWSRNVAL